MVMGVATAEAAVEVAPEALVLSAAAEMGFAAVARAVGVGRMVRVEEMAGQAGRVVG